MSFRLVKLSTRQLEEMALQLRQHNSLPALISSLAIGIADHAGLIEAKEQILAQPFVGVNLGR
jgi:hypothetical protein